MTAPARPRVADFLRDRVLPPLIMVGGFFRMCALTARALFVRPFQWRETLQQGWFITSVAIIPTIAVAIPLTVLLVFTLNILLAQFGAADVSGSRRRYRRRHPVGAAGHRAGGRGRLPTAICADLGARTIREEIDAMEVLGIDPIHRLVVPRVIAATVVALLLNALVIVIGLTGGFLFGVYLQNVSGGAYLSTLTLLTGLPEVVISTVKASVFGLIAGLVGCYRGLTVRGGSKGLGTAVNETVVLCVLALFAVNVVLTTIGVKFGTGT